MSANVSDPDAAALREQIRALAAEYHAAAFPTREFVRGVTPVPVSGKVVGGPELANLFDAALDLWLTEGRFADELEARLAAQVVHRGEVDQQVEREPSVVAQPLQALARAADRHEHRRVAAMSMGVEHLRA
jgi:hypothetical protein